MAPGMSATEHITHPPVNFGRHKNPFQKKTCFKGLYYTPGPAEIPHAQETDRTQLVDGPLKSPHLIRRSKPTPMAELRRVEGES